MDIGNSGYFIDEEFNKIVKLETLKDFFVLKAKIIEWNDVSAS